MILEYQRGGVWHLYPSQKEKDAPLANYIVLGITAITFVVDTERVHSIPKPCDTVQISIAQLETYCEEWYRWSGVKLTKV